MVAWEEGQSEDDVLIYRPACLQAGILEADPPACIDTQLLPHEGVVAQGSREGTAQEQTQETGR